MSYLFKVLLAMIMVNRAILSEIYNVVVLGNTGVGKSSLLNMLAGNETAFKVGHNALSETQLTTHEVYHLMGKEQYPKTRLVDTQGLSDSGGDKSDMAHIRNMVKQIKELKEIDLFLLCLDGSNPRLTTYVKSTISLFSDIFPGFLSHTVLVFNKWTSPDLDKLNNLKKEYQEIFIKEYHMDKKILCYFIDSFFNLEMLRDKDDGSQALSYLHPNIQERTKIQIEAFIKYLIVKETTCNVRDIVPKDTEFTLLKKTVELENKATKDKLASTETQLYRSEQKKKQLEGIANMACKYLGISILGFCIGI